MSFIANIIISLFVLILVIPLTLGILYIIFKFFNKNIKDVFIGFIQNFIPKNSISQLKGKKNKMENVKEDLKNKYISISGDLSDLNFSYKTTEEQIKNLKDEYRNILNKLKNGEDISKKFLKNKKEVVDRKENILKIYDRRIKDLNNLKSNLDNKINTLDSKIQEVEAIINEAELSKNIRDMNIDPKDYDIDFDFSEVINEANRLRDRYKAESDAKDDLSSGKKSRENNENDITIDELELND